MYNLERNFSSTNTC